MELKKLVVKANAASKAAHKVLATHELSQSRVIHLEDLLKKLSGSPADVQDYFKEAIVCLEQGLYRAAIVMSWAGFFNVLAEKLYLNYETEIRVERKKWEFKDLNEFKEGFPEGQILEVAKLLKLISKPELRIYDGHLSTRNQCAHPTLYRPSLNTAIGYVEEMISSTLKHI